jgi:hypothetical protein
LRTSKSDHQCGGFEVPTIVAASSLRNFKSRTALEPSSF